MGVVRFTSRLIYPQRKRPWYALDMRLGGLQSRSGRGGEEVANVSGKNDSEILLSVLYFHAGCQYKILSGCVHQKGR